jgi:zeaxanthin glucosyltransferase
MKVGFVSLPLSGHLNPMISLARKVQSQGHDVVFIGVEDAASAVRAAGLEFHVVAREEIPLGGNADTYRELAKLRGLEIIRYFAATGLGLLCKTMLEYLPGAITELGIDALAIDTIHLFAELAAIRMNIPYVHVSNILHIDSTGATPPCSFSFPYEESAEARARNTAAVAELGELLFPVINVAIEYAEKHQLGIDWSVPGVTVSKTAVITQIPRVFDFPKVGCVPQFHYTGPFQDADARVAVPFPWERLDGRRIIYASLGTLVNGLEDVYRVIGAACSSIPDAQLVLSIGENVRAADLGPFPAGTIVVEKAPQLEILEEASLCITHAGANTVLESLSAGVPMIAIPIGFDQPGVAARVAYHGVGEFIEEEQLTEDALRSLILTVLDDPNYGIRAMQMKDEILAGNGLERAATILGESLREAVRLNKEAQEALVLVNS